MKFLDFISFYYKNKQRKHCFKCKKPIVGNGFWEIFRPDGKTHPICSKCEEEYFDNIEKVNE